MKQSSPPSGIKVIAKLMAILERLAGSKEPLPLGQISASVQLPKPTAYRIVQSLKKLGYVNQDPQTQNYSLASRFEELCRNRSGDGQIMEQSRESLLALGRRFQETVNLAVAEGDLVRFLEVVESPLPLRMSVPAGHRSPLFATALGKSILAHSNPERTRARVLSLPFKPLTRKTITTPDGFLKELAAVRQRGYALDDQEYSDECLCVAAAVLPRSGDPRFALSISMPASRVRRDRIPEIGKALVQECAKIAERLEQNK